ncbi:hypothetical protein PISL3812_09930 [Talaromyces islandicus]|uniref:Uncharacterized protein n=1 Tax=Talaromyces islandicus TaxID=28573 RepID=A0A0U1MB72_TALIS|nr:hypothetical protein PISL3812_09930 [Talaromyces islandicus]
MATIIVSIIASITACITGGSDNNNLTLQHISSDDNNLTIQNININYKGGYIIYGPDNEPRKFILVPELKQEFKTFLRDYCMNTIPPRAFLSKYIEGPINTVERLAAFHNYTWSSTHKVTALNIAVSPGNEWTVSFLHSKGHTRMEPRNSEESPCWALMFIHEEHEMANAKIHATANSEGITNLRATVHLEPTITKTPTYDLGFATEMPRWTLEELAHGRYPWLTEN